MKMVTSFFLTIILTKFENQLVNFNGKIFGQVIETRTHLFHTNKQKKSLFQTILKFWKVDLTQQQKKLLFKLYLKFKLNCKIFF